MPHVIRTDSSHPHFVALVAELDRELAIRDGQEHAFFAQYNKIDMIRHVVLAHTDAEPQGCGAIKEYAPGTMEVKRMYVPAHLRGQGIAGQVLAELERWATELGYQRLILETGIRQPEAIALYTKSGYQRIPNFGQYQGVESSVCFEKILPRTGSILRA